MPHVHSPTPFAPRTRPLPALLAALMTAALVVVAPGLGPTAAAAAETLCLGEPATIVGEPGTKVTGTEGDDVIVADGPVRALGGDDVVCGTDEIDAGDGNDRVLLTSDDPYVTGAGGYGDDELRVISTPLGPDNDAFRGPALDGGPGRDSLTSADGWDRLFGGPGDDVLTGGDGNDYLDGSTGADVLDGGPGKDLAQGGPDRDRCSAEEMPDCEAPLRWRTFTTCFGEQPTIVAEGGDVQGTDGDDVIVTEGGHVDAGKGDDLVCGAAMVEGGQGDDRILAVWGSRRFNLPRRAPVTGGGGDDHLSLTASADGSFQPAFLLGGPGDDVVLGTAKGDNLDGKRGDDRLVGRGGHDDLGSGPGADVLLGGDGRDLLYAGTGDDLLVGGTGRDYLYGWRGIDRGLGGGGRDECADVERRRSCLVER